MWLEQIIFYAFSLLLVSAALMTVMSRNPVHSALFLILAFFASVPLWILLHAEFLALVLVLVYVGAVMTLFLFVVMMLHVDETKKKNFVLFLPFGFVIVAVLVGLMIYILAPEHYRAALYSLPANAPADYSNAKELGSVLYTTYVLDFEIAACILLVSIVAAITLAFRGRQGGRRDQKPSEQVKVRRKDRVRFVNMPVEKN